jgi:hypothetical protein
MTSKNDVLSQARQTAPARRFDRRARRVRAELAATSRWLNEVRAGSGDAVGTTASQARTPQ